MLGSNLAMAMLVMSASVVEIVPLEQDRFTVSIVFSGSSPRVHADAQLALMQAAAKRCKGRGQAVSEGTLYLDKAEPDPKGHERLKLSETYSCVSKTKR